MPRNLLGALVILGTLEFFTTHESRRSTKETHRKLELPGKRKSKNRNGVMSNSTEAKGCILGAVVSFICGEARKDPDHKNEPQGRGVVQELPETAGNALQGVHAG